MDRPKPGRQLPDPGSRDDDPLLPEEDPLGIESGAEAAADEDDELAVIPEKPPEPPASEPPDPLDISTLYPPPPEEPEPEPATPAGPGLAEYLRLPDQRFSRPAFFRAFGRVAGCLGVVVLVVAVLVRAGFTAGLVLLVMFLVGEAAAVILDALARIQQELATSSPPKPPPAPPPRQPGQKPSGTGTHAEHRGTSP